MLLALPTKVPSSSIVLANAGVKSVLKSLLAKRKGLYAGCRPMLTTVYNIGLWHDCSSPTVDTRYLHKSVAGQNFCGLAAGKNFTKIFRGSTITKPHPYWVYVNHTHITRESAVMASEFSNQAMVCGYKNCAIRYIYIYIYINRVRLTPCEVIYVNRARLTPCEVIYVNM